MYILFFLTCKIVLIYIIIVYFSTMLQLNALSNELKVSFHASHAKHRKLKRVPY